MESRTDTRRTEPPPPIPPGDGARERPFTAAFSDLGRLLGELREHAAYLVSAKVDAVKLSLKKAAFFAVLGIFAAIAAVAAAATAAVLVLTGFSGGLSILLGGRTWLGELIVGLVVLLGMGLGLIGAWTVLKKTSYRRTVRKYDERQKRERERYGRGVADQAAREARERG